MKDNIKIIATENPQEEQWKLLLQYAYPANINKLFLQRNFEGEDKIVEFVAGSILQSHAYFEAANQASLYIKPLLVYYGVSNLMAGASTIITGEKLDIKGHGMKLDLHENLEKLIAFSRIKVVDENKGGFSNFNKVLTNNESLPQGTIWELKELFGSIPDLRSNFESCYSGLNASVIPVEIVKLKDRTMERISFEDCPYLKEDKGIFEKIDNFNKYYLNPQIQDDKIILNRKINYCDIGVYSIHGRKYLQVSSYKNGKPVKLDILMIMYMGLFALGYLSRYHPGIWNPFIQKDLTGEKLVVDKFLDISIRHIPNLILNIIEGKEIRFINETDGIKDLRFLTLQDDIKNIVSDAIQELYSKGMYR